MMGAISEKVEKEDENRKAETGRRSNGRASSLEQDPLPLRSRIVSAHLIINGAGRLPGEPWSLYFGDG